MRIAMYYACSYVVARQEYILYDELKPSCLWQQMDYDKGVSHLPTKRQQGFSSEPLELEKKLLPEFFISEDGKKATPRFF